MNGSVHDLKYRTHLSSHNF